MAERELGEAKTQYPVNLIDFLRRFPDEDAAWDYLASLRWPEGHRCSECDLPTSKKARGLLRCSKCHRQYSLIAGTLLQGTHIPLFYWLLGAWLVASFKDGISSVALANQLGVTQTTAWLLLQKLRRCMVRLEREKLEGFDHPPQTYMKDGEQVVIERPRRVEVDEFVIGGKATTKRRYANKQWIIVAAEYEQKPPPRARKDDPNRVIKYDWPTRISRIRMEAIADRRGEFVQKFVVGNVTPGSHLESDGYRGYDKLALPPAAWGLPVAYPMTRLIASGLGPNKEKLAPHVHRVVTLFRRWLRSTHQGAWTRKQLPHYLDEFTFRFNRKNSASRGLLFHRLLQLAMHTPPATKRRIVRSLPASRIVPLLQKIEDEAERRPGDAFTPILAGGWAVDAIVAGRQIRTHEDLDLLIPSNKMHLTLQVLKREGFKPLDEPPDYTYAWRLRNKSRQQIDLHPIWQRQDGSWEEAHVCTRIGSYQTISAKGNVYDKKVEEARRGKGTYPEEFTTEAKLLNQSLICVRPELQLTRKSQLSQDSDNLDCQLLSAHIDGLPISSVLRRWVLSGEELEIVYSSESALLDQELGGEPDEEQEEDLEELRELLRDNSGAADEDREDYS